MYSVEIVVLVYPQDAADGEEEYPGEKSVVLEMNIIHHDQTRIEKGQTSDDDSLPFILARYPLIPLLRWI